MLLRETIATYAVQPSTLDMSGASLGTLVDLPACNLIFDGLTLHRADLRHYMQGVVLATPGSGL